MKLKYSTFYIGDMYFGVDVSDVQAVLLLASFTRVPLARKEVFGVMNLRGQISPVMDMRSRLNLAAAHREGYLPTMVVNSGDGPVGLLVDDIADVRELDVDQSEPPPPTVPPNIRPYLSSVFKLERGLLLVLDLDAVLSFDATQ
ncbi:MAG: purine-binding chemotaxis protein CheW [Myxococcales bacterium]|nr:purine-binding chemotaxis protein CheW [Myxococcales bacterium]